MVADLSKLMLRAYNAEADNCVRSLRSGNISTAKKRLENAMKSIEKLGYIMEMRVNPDYHQLRVEELELTADYQMKVQEEKERARESNASCFESNAVPSRNSPPSGNGWRRRRRTTRALWRLFVPRATTPQRTSSRDA